MKFNKSSQLFLVSRVFLIATVGLLMATALTSCEITTIDYLFVASSKGSGTNSAGQIETYDVDSQTGAVRAGQPIVASGGINPVSMSVTHDTHDLYVANQGSSAVVHFALSGIGVLTQKDSVTLSTPPVFLTTNIADSYLYVVSGTSSATLTAYPLSAGVLGSPVADINLSLPGSFAGDTLIPTGVAVLANNNSVYVTVYDQSAYNPGGTVTSLANPGWVFGFTVGSGGALTPVAGSPFQAGVKPSAITSDPTNRFVYVTDFASNQMIGYTIQSTGALNFMVNGPFRTGNEPESVVVDQRGLYIYVANELDSSVSAYVINLATGTPSAAVNVTGSATNVTDTAPVSILVDTSLGRYVYTANHLGNSISGFQLNPFTGSLAPTLATPYPTTGFEPTALACINHGSHSEQSVAP